MRYGGHKNHHMGQGEEKSQSLLMWNRLPEDGKFKNLKNK